MTPPDRTRPLLVLLNPKAFAADLWPQLNAHLAAAESRTALRTGSAEAADGVVVVQTHPGDNVELARSAMLEVGPELVVAAGGDGTVRDVAEALLGLPAQRRPALAIAALGTANNVARSLGLESCRRGPAALQRAAQAIVAGRERRIDVGRANGRVFLGAFGVGMDADILALRNRLRHRVHERIGGYSLYLVSCAIAMFQRHARRARLEVENAAGEHLRSEARIYDLVALNLPIYAGEFRFCGGDGADDGLLDLITAAGPPAYLRSHIAAWPRHLRAQKGLATNDDAALRRVRRIRLELDRPASSQLDGEECPLESAFEIEILPSALVCRI